MKLSSKFTSSLYLLTLGYCLLHQIVRASRATRGADAQSLQSRLLDKCCQVGRERALESSKFNCKLSAREALTGSTSTSSNQQQQPPGRAHLLALSAESHFGEQCEMVLESCCLGQHRTRNCDTGKQFAKSGASCMDVELSKEVSVATESFNDCCMSCSLGILAARNPGQNETTTGGRQGLAARCKLLSPLASSLSGQLYEQTYAECCQENLPRLSSALVEPGAPIDCSQSNPCAQRCLAAGTFDSSTRRRLDSDRCDCFAGFRLASDGINCLDIDECKLNKHTCNRISEVCDNTRGSFRCLARAAADGHQASPVGRSSLIFSSSVSDTSSSSLNGGEELNAEFVPLRLCPLGSRWNSNESRCQSLTSSSSSSLGQNGDNGPQRSASLLATAFASGQQEPRSRREALD